MASQILQKRARPPPPLARWARRFVDCPFAFSHSATQLLQLPEFAQARELAARGEYAHAMPLISRTIDVCRAMQVPSMELFALEAKAHVQGTLGRVTDELATRELQRALASGGKADEAESLLIMHGMCLARLRRGDAVGARALATAAPNDAAADGLQPPHVFQLHVAAAAMLNCATETAAADLASDADGVDANLHAGATVLRAQFKLACAKAPAEALRLLAPLCAEGSDAPLETRAWAALLAGRAHVAAGAGAAGGDAERELARALKLWTEAAGDGSREVALTVLELAGLYAERRDPIMAEGLYRSATDKLLASSAAGSLASARALHTALRGYAALLETLSTNGRSRASEAAKLRAQADELAAGFDGALFAEGIDAQNQQLVDWAAQRCEYKWFR